jgi:hypothetical protein
VCVANCSTQHASPLTLTLQTMSLGSTGSWLHTPALTAVHRVSVNTRSSSAARVDGQCTAMVAGRGQCENNLCIVEVTSACSEHQTDSQRVCAHTHTHTQLSSVCWHPATSYECGVTWKVQPRCGLFVTWRWGEWPLPSRFCVGPNKRCG